MKKTMKLACLVGATMAVSACSGYSTYEQTPYQGRTAGSGVIVSKQNTQPAPAPMVETRSAQPVFKDAMRK